eukprot:1669554-Pleurochrysis_carterae.AAC.2
MTAVIRLRHHMPTFNVYVSHRESPRAGFGNEEKHPELRSHATLAPARIFQRHDAAARCPYGLWALPGGGRSHMTEMRARESERASVYERGPVWWWAAAERRSVRPGPA